MLPKVTNSRSDRKGHPPGVPAFGVNVNFDEIDRLRGLADATATSLEEISFGMAHFSGFEPEGEEGDAQQMAEYFAESGLLDDFNETEDSVSTDTDDVPHREIDWTIQVPPIELPPTRREGRPYVRFGDPYGTHATTVLRRHAPYCCANTGMDASIWNIEDVVAYQVSDTHYIIMGPDLPDVLVSKARLNRPEFNLPRWYHRKIAHLLNHRQCMRRVIPGEEIGECVAMAAETILNENVPHSDAWIAFRGLDLAGPRFVCHLTPNKPVVVVHDNYLFVRSEIPFEFLDNPAVDLPNLYALTIRRDFADPPFLDEHLEGELVALFDLPTETSLSSESFEFFASNFEHSPITTLQRNAATVKYFKRLIPESVIVVVNINGHPARALLDTGSMADFLSAKLVHQLEIQSFELMKQIPIQLAIQGSRAKVTCGCKAEVLYQSVKEVRYFDVINLHNYDVVLGTPFLYQHRISIGFNPISVVVGNSNALPIQGKQVRVLESRATDIYEDQLEQVRQQLREYARPIASNDASDTPLPPLRVINHQIPLKDPTKIYHWRPSRCPEALRPLWAKKRDAYLKS